jgi:hypothetical protein
MARIAAKVMVVANPVHPSQHGATPVVAGGETGDVYLSYDNTKITGYAQLHSALMAALGAITNGTFGANT